MLKVDNLRFEYIKGRTLLDGISFSAEDKEKLAVSGAPNSGKSTLLWLISKYIKGYDGSITLNGKEIKDEKIADLNVLYIGSDLMLKANQTVLENAKFGLKIRKYPKTEAEQRALKALELCGLSEHKDKKVKELCAVGKFLTALCRGIARAPDIVLIDDVFQGMENELSNYLEVKEMLLKLPFTTILATSNADVLKAYDLRTVVLSYGKIGYDGRFNQSPYVID